jgi:hypothetical protein
VPNGSCLLIESGSEGGMELAVLDREKGKLKNCSVT